MLLKLAQLVKDRSDETSELFHAVEGPTGLYEADISYCSGDTILIGAAQDRDSQNIITR